MENSLKQAIDLMKNGDENGFNEVYSQTYNRVYFRAKQIMKKEEDAQDLTQIVFVEAYKCINSLQSPEALYSWLDGITYRQGMKIFRKQKDVLLTEEAEGLFDTLENNDITTVPELTVDQKATSEIIRGIMEELPELQKTAVVMFYFDGMKVEQIADVMECSANTIKSRLNYARKYLKDRVVEKEKKEGYRLHTLIPPVLWYAIKTLSDKTTLTAHAAQEVYAGACSTVGLQATAITATTGAGVGASASASSTTGAVVGETAKTASIGAKVATLSTGVKTLIIAGTVTALGIGAVGAVTLLNPNDKDEIQVSESQPNESTDMTMQLDEGVLKDNLSEYLQLSVNYDNSSILDATKISDTKYCFYAKDIQEYFSMNEWVDLISYLPDNIGVSLVEFETPHDKFTNPAQSINEDNIITFKIQTDYDIFITLDYMENITYEPSVTESEYEAEIENEDGKNYANVILIDYNPRDEIDISGTPKRTELKENETYITEDKQFIVGYDNKVYTDEYGFLLYRYIGNETEVTLPKEIQGYPVFEVRENMFSVGSVNDTIEKIIVESEIEVGQFRDCTALKEVIFPATMKRLAYNSFWNTPALEKVTVDNSCVVNIDFGDSRDIIVNYVPMSEGIGENTNIVMEDGQSYATADGKLQFIFTKETIELTKYLDSNTEVTIPKEIQGYPITYIHRSTFEENNNIEKVIIEAEITTGRDIFSNCLALKEVILPVTVTELTYIAFYNTPQLEAITVGKDCNVSPNFAGWDMTPEIRYVDER